MKSIDGYWIKEGTDYKSRDGKYKIKKYSDQYCLYTKKFNIMCLMISMGELDEVKLKAEKMNGDI